MTTRKNRIIFFPKSIDSGFVCSLEGDNSSHGHSDHSTVKTEDTLICSRWGVQDLLRARFRPNIRPCPNNLQPHQFEGWTTGITNVESLIMFMPVSACLFSRHVISLGPERLPGPQRRSLQSPRHGKRIAAAPIPRPKKPKEWERTSSFASTDFRILPIRLGKNCPNHDWSTPPRRAGLRPGGGGYPNLMTRPAISPSLGGHFPIRRLRRRVPAPPET